MSHIILIQSIYTDAMAKQIAADNTTNKDKRSLKKVAYCFNLLSVFKVFTSSANNFGKGF
jgi:hypothetical protein